MSLNKKNANQLAKKLLKRLSSIDRLACAAVFNCTSSVALIAKDGLASFLNGPTQSPPILPYMPWLTADAIAGILWLASEPPLIFGSNSKAKEHYAKTAYTIAVLGGVAFAYAGWRKGAMDQLTAGILYSVAYSLGAYLPEKESVAIPPRLPQQTCQDYLKFKLIRHAQNFMGQPLKVSTVFETPALIVALSTCIHQRDTGLWISALAALGAVTLTWTAKRDTASPLTQSTLPAP